MARKTLDVDVLAPEPDVFVFGGVEYPLGDLDSCRWEDFDRFGEVKPGMPRDMVHARVSAVSRLPVAVLEKLTLPQFQAVVEHIIAPLAERARAARQQEESSPSPSVAPEPVPALPTDTAGATEKSED